MNISDFIEEKALLERTGKAINGVSDSWSPAWWPAVAVASVACKARESGYYSEMSSTVSWHSTPVGLLPFSLGEGHASGLLLPCRCLREDPGRECSRCAGTPGVTVRGIRTAAGFDRIPVFGAGGGNGGDIMSFLRSGVLPVSAPVDAGLRRFAEIGPLAETETPREGPAVFLEVAHTRMQGKMPERCALSPHSDIQLVKMRGKEGAVWSCALRISLGVCYLSDIHALVLLSEAAGRMLGSSRDHLTYVRSVWDMFNVRVYEPAYESGCLARAALRGKTWVAFMSEHCPEVWVREAGVWGCVTRDSGSVLEAHKAFEGDRVKGSGKAVLSDFLQYVKCHIVAETLGAKGI